MTNKDQFLKELTELSYKYNLVISVDLKSNLMFLHDRDKDYMCCDGYVEVIKNSGFIEWCDA